MSCCIFNKCKQTQSSKTVNLSSIVCLNENIEIEIYKFNNKNKNKNNKNNNNKNNKNNNNKNNKNNNNNKNKNILYPNTIYNNDECIICFNIFQPTDLIKLLHCKHIFHKKCLDKWFKKKAVCPICNTNGV